MKQRKAPMKILLIVLIKAWQMLVSPLYGWAKPCRFRPSCSQYGLEAVQEHGAIKGGWLALKRIARCNPFYRGPCCDPVPSAKSKAPWTVAQVDRLQERQRDLMKHPYTCECGKNLVPTVYGWACDCGYTQDWCHKMDLKENANVFYKK